MRARLFAGPLDGAVATLAGEQATIRATNLSTEARVGDSGAVEVPGGRYVRTKRRFSANEYRYEWRSDMHGRTSGPQ